MSIALEAAADWGPLQRQRARDRIAQLAHRQRIIAASDHPAALAATCDPYYRITPAVDLVSRQIERVLRSRRKRLMITAPPQEFKSRLSAVWTPLRALQLHPDWRIMLLTYADGLAEEHSKAARAIIQEFGSGVVDTLTGAPLPDRLGISLREGDSSSGKWRIAEGEGGLVAAGRDATITGRPCDLLIVDDPIKNMQEADSETIRKKVIDWYDSVASTRLAPGASVILIQTRWHEQDLAGHLLEHDHSLPAHLREWRYINIPAVSHPKHPDALNRPPGVALESARGRTAEDFAAIERAVGKRVWTALYQGSPTPPEGGLFSQEWFDTHRMAVLPERTLARVVAVDPSESGEGDEAGIVAAAMLEGGRVAFTHDRSAPLTSDRWAAEAVQLALDTDASDIVVETYTAKETYLKVVRTHIQARIRTVARQLRTMSIAVGGKADRMRAELTETLRKLQMLKHRVRPWRGTGDAVARSGLLRQAVEVGTAAVLDHAMAAMESQAVFWQAGQHQPDRVAAAVIAHDRLVEMAGKVAHIGAPTRGSNHGRNDWLARKVG